MDKALRPSWDVKLSVRSDESSSEAQQQQQQQQNLSGPSSPKSGSSTPKLRFGTFTRKFSSGGGSGGVNDDVARLRRSSSLGGKRNTPFSMSSPALSVVVDHAGNSNNSNNNSNNNDSNTNNNASPSIVSPRAAMPPLSASTNDLPRTLADALARSPRSNGASGTSSPKCVPRQLSPDISSPAILTQSSATSSPVLSPSSPSAEKRKQLQMMGKADVQLPRRVVAASPIGAAVKDMAAGVRCGESGEAADDDAVEEGDRAPRVGSMAIPVAMETRPVLKSVRRSVAADDRSNANVSADEDDEDERLFVYGGHDSDRVNAEDKVKQNIVK